MTEIDKLMSKTITIGEIIEKYIEREDADYYCNENEADAMKKAICYIIPELNYEIIDKIAGANSAIRTHEKEKDFMNIPDEITLDNIMTPDSTDKKRWTNKIPFD